MGNKDMKGLREQGYGITPVWGGAKKVRYYAPDGTFEDLQPAYRERQDKVVYDVLLAKGYSLTPPENPKPHCSGCSYWHNTQKEVVACIKKRKASMEYYDRKARKEIKTGDTEVTELKDKVDKLEGLLEKVLEKLGE